VLHPENQRVPISPLIYGIGANLREGHYEHNVWSLNPGLIRWGGNTSERFNWRINSWNTGQDWYFLNVNSRIKNVVDSMITDNNAHGVVSSITIPFLGWVAKDSVSSSFPVSVFGHQQSENNGSGNGIDLSGHNLSTEPERTSVPFTVNEATQWVQHLKTLFPPAGRKIYIVGNEPMLWNSTHRDVHPSPTTYDEVASKYIATATAIRRADPTAIITGPALWGWLATEQSAFDEPGEWSQGRRREDRKKHGNVAFLPWFVDQVLAAEEKLGLSLIDAIDVHFYPENRLVRDSRQASTPEARLARLRSTRSLWDDQYVDESWIDDKIEMIPRLKRSAQKKNGLDVCIGEYNFFGENDIGGALAFAEAIGIFARQKILCAAYWTFPPEGSPTAAVFKLLRNYDGRFLGLGSELISNSLEISEQYSVLTTFEASSEKLTILILNKSKNEDHIFSLAIPGSTHQSTCESFAVTAESPNLITKSKINCGNGFQLKTSAFSAHLIVVDGFRF
jgi:Glycoside hydrolase family 44